MLGKRKRERERERERERDCEASRCSMMEESEGGVSYGNAMLVGSLDHYVILG